MFETMVSIGIIATGLMVMIQQLSISFRESEHNENRAFAHEKTSAILGELNNAIAMGLITNSDELYAFADTEPNPVLTTRTDAEGLPFPPFHSMSGNVLLEGEWAWSRTITITPNETTGLYYCRVQVSRRHGDSWRVEASNALQFSLLPSADSPEQVFDVYALACAGTPSLWTDLADARQHVERAARQGLGNARARLRIHWIDRLGYGRDPCYAPYVNATLPATDAAPFAYWLPGALGSPHRGKQLYRAELLRGLHRTEQGLQAGLSDENTIPVSLADQWNHCMRTPTAWRVFDERVAAGLEDPSSPPLQLLLDDMSRRPERYRNAIFVNLHGRGLPAPPLRNYSDAAKEPVDQPGVRVVTHPRNLWVPRDPDNNGDHSDTESVELRVFGYRAAPGAAVMTEPITIQIFGADLTGDINGGPTTTMDVRRQVGGVNTNTGLASGTGRSYSGFDSSAGLPPAAPEEPYEMWFESGYVAGAEPYTWLRLHNTPLVAPRYSDRGLKAEARLYGLEYAPSPLPRELGEDNSTTCNTARWRITIPAQVANAFGASDQMLRVVTRIGTDTSTGQLWPTAHQPLNLSETFTWWTHSPSAVPITERSQFLGDPRLNPYEDLLASGAFAHGYNWHFDNLQNTTQNASTHYPNLSMSRLQDGCGTGNVLADAPRFFELYREGLERCGGVLVNTSTAFADTLLLGGEIAWPTAEGTEPVSLHTDYTAGSFLAVDTIASQTADYGTLVLHENEAVTWWTKPWLGELFPDSQAATWYHLGNLPIAGSLSLRWSLLSDLPLPDLPYGADSSTSIGARIGPAGIALLANHGTPTSTVGIVELPASEWSVPQDPTKAINKATNIVPPPRLPAGHVLSANRSIDPSVSAFSFTDTYPRSTLTSLEVLWGSQSGIDGGSFVLDRTGTGYAFLVPWAIEPTAEQSAEITLQSLLAGMRTLHRGGLLTPGHISQVPYLQVIEPLPGAALTDPMQVTVRWSTSWQRFDGQPYDPAYPTTFAESESDLVYRILWSGDDGATWTSAITNAPALTDQYPDDPADRLIDAGTGSEAYSFDFPSTAPSGHYVFYVEAWRLSTRCHFATHRVRAFVRRTL